MLGNWAHWMETSLLLVSWSHYSEVRLFDLNEVLRLHSARSSRISAGNVLLLKLLSILQPFRESYVKDGIFIPENVLKNIERSKVKD